MSAPRPRTALVTGAAGAIGSSIAASLHEAGYRLALCDRDPRVESVAGRFAGSAWRAFDVADREAAAHAVGELAAEIGAADTVVIAAALVDRVCPALELRQADWDAELSVNLSGALWCIQAAAPAMRELGFGRVIVISSAAGEVGAPGQVAYASSKAGLLGMTRTLAIELAPHGITCNLVSPGTIETPKTALLSERGRERLIDNVPLRRFGTSDEVAALVRYLASEAAGYVTGASIPVDGGSRLNTASIPPG